MSSLWHGFLDDVAVDIFAGRFSFWQLQKFFQRQRFRGGLNHSNYLRNDRIISVSYSKGNEASTTSKTGSVGISEQDFEVGGVSGDRGVSEGLALMIAKDGSLTKALIVKTLG